MDRSGGGTGSGTDVVEQTTVTAAKKKPFGRGKAVTEVVQIERLRLARVQLTIIGDTPLIMHRFSEKGGLEAMRAKQWQIADMTKKKRDAKDPIELFVACAHTMPNTPAPKVKGTKEGFLEGREVTMTGKFCLPFAYLKGAIESAAADVNGISKAQVRRAIQLVEYWVPLKTSHAVMREDLVRLNDQNRTADIRYRPEFAEWEATFTVEFNAGVLSTNTVVNLFNIAGFAAGIGEWRPEKGGVSGRFHVKEQ